MCTALTLSSEDGYSFFGRNLDLGYTFGQQPMLVRRGFKFQSRITNTATTNKYAIMGIGLMIDGYPSLFDGMNEKGVAIAGLNLPGAYYTKTTVPGKLNLAPYEIMPWALSNYDNVQAIKADAMNMNIVDTPLNAKTPNSTMHWMVTDTTGQSIVIEQTQMGLVVYDNPVGVLTNAPTFDWHLNNLRRYMTLSVDRPAPTKWSDYAMEPLGEGVGSIGLPGDLTPASRFIRVAFNRANMPIEKDMNLAVTEYFHMLQYVAMPHGVAKNERGVWEQTLYSSCMNLQKGLYYYTTYANQRINAVNMTKEQLDGGDVKMFAYQDSQDINYQN